MRDRTLEERVAQLEQRVDELAETAPASSARTPARDWRRTVGMFRRDPIMKEIIDGTLRLREEERRVAHEEKLVVIAFDEAAGDEL